MGNKIVFFDIDETILDGKKQIPQSTKIAINQLKNKGIDVAIATGRAPTMFAHILSELGINSYVCCNGSYVVYNGEVVYKEVFDEVQFTNLAQTAKKNGLSMVFSNEQHLWTNNEKDQRVSKVMQHLRFDYKTGYTKNKLDDIIYGLMFCEENEEAFLKEFNTLRFLRWHKYTMDIIPFKGSKASGIKKMLERLNIKRENSYAFGDGMNDMEMIAYVGVGVAMGNAVNELKSIADYVTKDVEENGIKFGLESIGLL